MPYILSIPRLNSLALELSFCRFAQVSERPKLEAIYFVLSMSNCHVYFREGRGGTDSSVEKKKKQLTLI